MACQQEDLTVDIMNVPTSVFGDVESAFANDQHRLLVSDNPEILNESSFPGTTCTLWHDIVCSDEESVTHRLFGWHRNETGQPLQLGVTVQNLSTSTRIAIQHIHRDIHIDPLSNQMIQVGQCLAKSCLSRTLEHYTSVDQHADVTSTAMIESVRLDTNYFAGFIYEFTIERDSGAGEMEYAIRTVASRDVTADIRLIHSDPLTPYGTHPRGSWPYAEVHASMPAYIIGTERVYRVCARKKMNGEVASDFLFAASASELREGAVDNTGQFGTIYLVDIPLHNDTEEEAVVSIYVNPRGGAFAGAIFVDGKVSGVPLMKDNTNVCLIAKVVAPVGVRTFQCKLMTAGESNLPLGIYLK
jgi:hypothetical protein